VRETRSSTRCAAGGLQVGIESGGRVGGLRARLAELANHAGDLTRSGGATGRRLRLIPRVFGVDLIKAARRSAMVDILRDQIMFADVANVIQAYYRSRTNFFFKSQVHLP